MKNREKYKTPEERTRAFIEQYEYLLFPFIESTLNHYLKWLDRDSTSGSSSVKPCPFCKGKAIAGENLASGGFKVSCTSCHAETKSCTTLENAIDLWNKRS